MGMLDEALTAISKAAEENGVKTETYEKDGLKHCAKCHKPKEQIITIGDMERRVPVTCKCDTERIEKAEREQLLKKAKEKTDELRKQAFTSSAMRTWTFKRDDKRDERISNAMRRYIEHFGELHRSGQGILLYGTVGTGKSFYAACIVNAVLDLNITADKEAKTYTACMTNFSRILNQLQNSLDGRQEYIDRLCGHDLLAIDDLGIERDSSFAREQVYNIINERYISRKPTIITTNLTFKEIAECQSTEQKRIYDRVLEMCHPIELKGESRRREAVKNRYESMNKLLGL